MTETWDSLAQSLASLKPAPYLGLATSSPQGVFVGAQPWVVDVATTLEKSDITCLVVDREYAALSGARMAGVTTEVANILSDYAVRDMELAGIGRLIACTPDDEVNATAAREFAHVLGRANVYQPRCHGVDEATPADNRKQTAGHAGGGDPGLDHPRNRSRCDRAGQRTGGYTLRCCCHEPSRSWTASSRPVRPLPSMKGWMLSKSSCRRARNSGRGSFRLPRLLDQAA